MREILKLTFTDKGFKAKTILFKILIIIIGIGVLSLPIALMSIVSVALNTLGVIFFLIAMLFEVIVACWIVINLLIANYYPEVKTSASDLLYKGLAIITVFYPSAIVTYIVLVLLFAISLFTTTLISVIIFIISVIYVYYLCSFALGFMYIVLETIENKQLGYKCVFRELEAKLKKNRKFCSKIVIQSVLYIIAANLVLLIGAVVLGLIGGLISIAFNLDAIYYGSILIIYIAFICTNVWFNANIFNFIVIRYAQAKELNNQDKLIF